MHGQPKDCDHLDAQQQDIQGVRCNYPSIQVVKIAAKNYTSILELLQWFRKEMTPR